MIITTTVIVLPRSPAGPGTPPRQGRASERRSLTINHSNSNTNTITNTNTIH